MEHHIADVLGLVAEALMLFQGLASKACIGADRMPPVDAKDVPDCSLRNWPHAMEEKSLRQGE